MKNKWITNPRNKALIEWMDELILDEKRDERSLFSIWQSIRAELLKQEKLE